MEFVNRDLRSPAVVVAMAHARLVTIHPFADGNGRVGRALVHVILKSSAFSRSMASPVSLDLAAERERYIASLESYRFEGGDEGVEAVDGWVEYFANAMALSCGRATGFEQT